MEEGSGFSAFGMIMVGGFLVVPVNVELDDDYALGLRKAILQKVKVTEAKGVLFDVSVLRILDAFSFSILADTAKMVSMLGAGVVFVGIQPGVASALVDLDLDMGNIETAVSMDDGFALLHSRVSGLSKPQEKEGNGTLMDSLDATGAI
jgi:rsbT antagonist protein RsbS